MKNGKNKKEKKQKQKITLHAWNRTFETKSFSHTDWKKIIKVEKEYLDKGYTVALKKVGS